MADSKPKAAITLTGREVFRRFVLNGGRVPARIGRPRPKKPYQIYADANRDQKRSEIRYSKHGRHLEKLGKSGGIVSSVARSVNKGNGSPAKAVTQRFPIKFLCRHHWTRRRIARE
jgi:hypothetical protein